MGFTETRCIVLHCDGCAAEFCYDDVPQHFSQGDTSTARHDAAEMDWGITDEGELCPACWVRKVCAQMCAQIGHVPVVGDSYCDRCEAEL